ncbi:hypothetical protein TNCV_1959761 [Trichonephila clavipes]|nr:hypothetical protein TNCV_1959761 [Trichonephila clavipes]
MYSSDTLSQMQAFKRHQRFREGRESIKDDKCSGHPRLPAPLKTLKRFLWMVCSIFPEHSHCFQGRRRFPSADEIKSASQAELKDMSKNGY